MKLHLSQQKSAIRLETRDNDTLIARASSRFNSDKDFAKVAHELEIDVDVLRAAVTMFEASGPCVVNLDTRRHTVYMRGIRSSDAVTYEAESTLDAFRLALAATDADITEPVIYWDGFDELAALDLDAKPGYEWDHAKLLTLDTVPTPHYAWVTKGGGLRLIYSNADPYTAEEIAAVAFTSLRNMPHTSLEIKRDTRHPAYATPEGYNGEVIPRAQQFDAAHLRRHLQLYSTSDAEVAEWLAERGMEKGVHYEHRYCPVDPDRPSHTKPVGILDNGIFCFSCEAHGISAGSSRPGFFPFAYLCGTSTSSLLYKCMEAGTHWEHAKHIMQSKLDLAGRYAALVYSAGLLLHGHGRKLAQRTFSAGANCIRMSDKWTNNNGEPYIKSTLKPILATLPACQTPKGAANMARIAEFEQSFDLSQYGYPSITPVYGIRIWQQPTKDITAVIQTRELSDDSRIAYRPRYVKPAERMPGYWEYIEQAFPGLNRNYIKLLIAARGVAESGVSMPPIVFGTGPTGAGKTLSAFLAASICGDRNSEIVWTSNSDRLRQNIMDAPGSMVCFNEVMKEAKSALSAMDFLLNLTPESRSHYMYVGPVRMGRLPAIILTDTELSLRIKQDAQLARRLVHVHLNDPVDWEASCKAMGVRHPSDYRTSSEKAAAACNAVVSEVIDEFFREQFTFQEIAEKLGFTRLSKSAEAEEARAALLTLFNAVCLAPEANGEAFVSGRGWCVIRRAIETDAQKAWLAVCEENFTSSRRCSEIGWRKLVGSTEDIFFELRAQGADKIAVRFRNANASLVNMELRR